MLSFKNQTSVIIYKNLKEITCLCIISQNPHIISFGTVTGAIKDYDIKSELIVRSSARRHKKAITSLHSEGKFLVSCSTEDNLIVVFDY
jgi:hypothetical protein